MENKSKDKELNPADDHIRSLTDISRFENDATKNTETGENQTPDADDLKSQEESSSIGGQGLYRSTKGSSKKGKFTSILKKKGPAGGIIGVLLLGLVGIGGGMLIPSTLIVHMKEVFVKSLNDADPALTLRTNKVLWHKVNSIANGFEESSTGKCNIKCKFGTVSESMKLNLEKSGTKFNVEFQERSVAGIKRYSIKSFSYEGKTVTNSSDFMKLMENPAAASEFKTHFNSRTAYFLNSKFSTVLRQKFGLNKAAKVTGDTLDKAKASLRQSLGLEGDKATTTPISTEDKRVAIESNPRYSATLKTIESVNTKATALSMVCTAYNVGKTTTFAVKAAKMAAFASFAMLFLTMADQIKAGGNPSPAAVEQLGNQLTGTNTDKNSVNFGKSATDSLGYKMSAYNDSSSLSSEDQRFSIAPVNSVASFVGKLTGMLLAAGGTSLLLASLTCKGSTVASLLAACAAELTVAIAGAIETAGVASVGGLGACAIKLIVTTVAASAIISALLGKTITSIINDDLPILDETTTGTDTGNALRSGTASIMGGSAASYGLRAGSQDDIKQYALDTATIRSQNEAIARYEARNTPFDVTNEYSFLGSVFTNLGFYNVNTTSLSSILSNAAALIPRSFSYIMPSSYAATTEAVSKAALYNKCDDWTLGALGIGADALCNPSYVMSSTELNSDIGDVTDFMISSKNIDEDTGEPMPDSEYSKYMEYCVNRVDPLGETSLAVEDDDYVWAVGINCVDKSNTTFQKFRTFTMDLAINQTMDEYAY